MVSDESSKKKASKKKAGKKKASKKASKKTSRKLAAASAAPLAAAPQPAKRGRRKRAAESSALARPGNHVQALANAGVLDMSRMLDEEIDIINQEFSDEVVEALIRAHEKLAPQGKPIVFVCF